MSGKAIKQNTIEKSLRTRPSVWTLKTTEFDFIPYDCNAATDCVDSAGRRPNRKTSPTGNHLHHITGITLISLP
jgi:hypothetical protein